MKFFWIGLALMIGSLMLNGCFSVKSTATFSYQKLSPDAYQQAMRADTNFYLIDVRTPAEYQKAHIKGARNYDFLAFHFGRDVDTLDRNKTAYLYCHTCHRSPFAAKEMKKRGFKKVVDLREGFANWLWEGKPVER